MGEDDFYDGPWTECWNCAGEGTTYSCFEEYACIDPEGGCDDCASRCSVCRGKGGWETNADTPQDGTDPQLKAILGDALKAAAAPTPEREG